MLNKTKRPMSFKPTTDIRLTASEFNRRNHYGIEPAVALAREVLTDANAHREARILQRGEELVTALNEALVQLQDEYPEEEYLERTVQMRAVLAKINN